MKTFFIDYFKGVEFTRFNLLTLDHVIVFTAVILEEITEEMRKDIGFAEIGQLIMFRYYKVEYQQSSNVKLPYIHLKEIGPSMDLHCRRHEIGNDEIVAKAQQHPEHKMTSNKIKRKNVTKGMIAGEQRGRLHLEIRDQNIDKLSIKNMKPLRDRKRAPKVNFKSGGSRNKKRNRLMRGWKDPNAGDE